MYDHYDKFLRDRFIAGAVTGVVLVIVWVIARVLGWRG